MNKNKLQNKCLRIWRPLQAIFIRVQSNNILKKKRKHTTSLVFARLFEQNQASMPKDEQCLRIWRPIPAALAQLGIQQPLGGSKVGWTGSTEQSYIWPKSCPTKKIHSIGQFFYLVHHNNKWLISDVSPSRNWCFDISGIFLSFSNRKRFDSFR